MSAEAKILKMEPPTQFRDLPEYDIGQAKMCRDDIRRHDKGHRARLLDFHEHKGWKALRYSTIEECAIMEFSMSRARYFQLLDAAAVDRNIRESEEAERDRQFAREKVAIQHQQEARKFTQKESTIVDSKPAPLPDPLPESHARELSKAPPEMQHEIHKEVTAKGPATAADYKEAIEKKGIIVTINKKERGEKRDDVAKRGKKRANKMKKAIRLLQKAQEALNSVLENGWAKRIADLAYEIQRAV